jgi:dolichol kinase
VLEMTVVKYGDLRNAYPASVPDSDVRSFFETYRTVAIVCAVLGMAIGYFAGRTRGGNKRFRRGTVALSVAGVVLLLAATVLFSAVTLLAVLAVIPLLVAVVAATREPASEWFDAVDSRERR